MQLKLISFFHSIFSKSTVIVVIASTIAVSGCTNIKKTSHNPQDPLESINRITYQFNDVVDKATIRPVAQAYKTVTPWPIRKGVTNFFSNMGEVPTMVNDALQLEVRYALNDFWRFVINTTVGVAGIFDIATDAGIEKRYNDFGITLAKYGITEAPYIVIPFIGPSTIRDGLALAVDYEYFTIWPYIYNIALRNSMFAVDVVNLRASLLDAENVMDQAALDPYVFIRDAYLQKRKSLIASNGSFANVRGRALTTQSTDADELDFALGDSDS